MVNFELLVEFLNGDNSDHWLKPRPACHSPQRDLTSTVVDAASQGQPSSMAIGLVDLPTDVLFCILSQMRLDDAWSFTAVRIRYSSESIHSAFRLGCFRELTTDRGFWLSALKNDPAMASVSNPLKLQHLDLQTLRQLALQCIKLDRNWSLPRPRIIGEVRRWHLGERSILETNHLFRFPGTELFIFHSSKFLKCFNCGTGETTTTLDLDAYVRCASYDFLPDKSIILGLALRGGSRFNVWVFF